MEGSQLKGGRTPTELLTATGGSVGLIRRPLVLAALLVLLAAATVWLATAPRPHVPVPPNNASPEQVVRAYLAASTAHDVDTMNALIAGNHLRPQSRFETTWTVRDVRTSPPQTDQWMRQAQPGYAEVVNVAVRMHVLKGHDLNFPDDANAYWGYMLARHSPREPWRIVDQGVG